MLKNQLMLQGKSLLQQTHRETLGSHAVRAEAGDGDGFLHPGGVGILWPEKQTPWVPLRGIFHSFSSQRPFHFTSAKSHTWQF